MISSDSPSYALTGYGFVLTAAVLWAASGTAAKHLFGEGITPFALVQMRLTTAAVGLSFWLAVVRPRRLVIRRSDVGYFLIYGTIGMAAVQFTYLFAISRIHVAAAILLQYTAPAFIVAYLVVFRGERPSPVTLVSVAVALAGCFAMVGGVDLPLSDLDPLGIASGLLSAVTFAWYSVHGEHGMRRYSPWTVLCYALVVGAAIWQALYPPLTGFAALTTPAQWGWVVFIGICGTLIPFGCYLEGVRRIRSTRASITATAEPISAGVIAYAALGEVLSPFQLAGAATVVCAIILLQLDSMHTAGTASQEHSSEKGA